MLNESDYTVLPEDYNSFDKSFKVIIVGNSGVGKSCITTKATKNIFENYYSATIGFEFHTFKVRVKGKDIRLQIWDINKNFSNCEKILKSMKSLLYFLPTLYIMFKI